MAASNLPHHFLSPKSSILLRSYRDTGIFVDVAGNSILALDLHDYLFDVLQANVIEFYE